MHAPRTVQSMAEARRSCAPARCHSRTSWHLRRPGAPHIVTSTPPKQHTKTSIPLYPSWLSSGELPRRRWDDPSVLDFLREGRPVVLTGGCPLMQSVVDKWDFDYLSRAYGAENTLTVHMAPRAERRFARFYGKGLGKGAVSSMTFAGFVETASANEARDAPPWRYYMQVPLVWSPSTKGGKYGSGGGELRTAAGPLQHARFRGEGGAGAEMADDVRSRIGWDWLARSLEIAESGGIHSCTLWAGMLSPIEPKTLPLLLRSARRLMVSGSLSGGAVHRPHHHAPRALHRGARAARPERSRTEL